MNKLLFAGTFDPPTRGHLDIIRRAALRGPLTVGIFINPEKTCLFSPEERAEMLRLAVADIPGVSVIIDEGYTADYAKAGGYTHLVRGFRDEEDLAYEEKMAAYNLTRGGIETILLPADPALIAVSSTRIREALSCGDDEETLRACLPDACYAYLAQKGKINSKM